MTVSEASAVNTLISYVVGKRDTWTGVPPPSSEEARGAAEYLAGRAHKTLMAGWTEAAVERDWPEERP